MNYVVSFSEGLLRQGRKGCIGDLFFYFLQNIFWGMFLEDVMEGVKNLDDLYIVQTREIGKIKVLYIFSAVLWELFVEYLFSINLARGVYFSGKQITQHQQWTFARQPVVDNWKTRNQKMISPNCKVIISKSCNELKLLESVNAWLV